MHYGTRLLIRSLLLAAVWHATAVAQVGYRLTNDAIHIDQVNHWQEWIYQNDKVTTLNTLVDSSGLFILNGEGIRPIFFRGSHNAALSASGFAYSDLLRKGGELVQGGAEALSNNLRAGQAIDGDLETYWEPAEADFSLAGLRNWELLIDLGRLVFIDSITVVFPSGQQLASGDPPKSLRIFGSAGEPFPFPLGSDLAFVQLDEILETDLAIKKDEGIVRHTIQIEPLLRADFDLDGVADQEGSFLHYIRLKVTGSDLQRDLFIGADEEARMAYEELPPHRRGAVVYQRLTAGDILIEVDEDTYFNDVVPAQQGPIRYFAKEVPRILDVEVWTKGDNLAAHPQRRAGGSYEKGGRGTPSSATDNLYQTEWTAWGFSEKFNRGIMWLDLGATFWVNSMNMVIRRGPPGSEGPFILHEFLVSDGTQTKPVFLETTRDFEQLRDALNWESIVSEGKFDNRNARVLMFGERFAPRKVRFMQVRNGTTGEEGAAARLAEIQLFGEGYPTSIWLNSPPIALVDNGGNFIRKTMARVSWQGSAVLLARDPISGELTERLESLALHPDVGLEIQTRTSDLTDSIFTYAEVVDIAGAENRTEITENAYNDLVEQWAVWNAWEALPVPHVSKADDDGDIDEDPIDFIDNDGDGAIDEDGKKLGRGRRPKEQPDKEGDLAFVGWSEWSSSVSTDLTNATALISSPNPRKFLQVRINIQSEDPMKTALIRSVSVELNPPLALELAGELAVLNPQGSQRPLDDLDVEPEDYSRPRDIDPLVPQRFSYFLRVAGPDPTDPAVQDGVDELLISGPKGAVLRGIRLGQVRVLPGELNETGVPLPTSVLESRFDRAFVPAGANRLEDAEGQVMEVLSVAGSDSLHMRFPFSLNMGLPQNLHTLVEVQFDSQVFRQRVAFNSSVRYAASPDPVFQRVEVDGQDATELINSSTTRPGLSVENQGLIHSVEVGRVFTPNGDGINDQLSGRFVLLRIMEERPVEVVFSDLAGRRMGQATWSAAPAAGAILGQAGALDFTWDERDGAGHLVPPGVYLCKIRLNADSGTEDLVRTVHVVY
jgi:hypothetical protein